MSTVRNPDAVEGTLLSELDHLHGVQVPGQNGSHVWSRIAYIMMYIFKLKVFQ